MPTYVILAAAAIAVALPLLWWSVAGVRVESRTISRDVLLGGRSATDLRTIALQSSARERAGVPLVAGLAAVTRRLTTKGWIDAIDRRLMLAGRPPAWPLERVLAAKFVLGAAAFAVGFMFFAENRSVAWLLCWFILSAIGYFAPDLLLHSRGQERQAAIGNALPDTLDQMTISVEAGLGFDSAMARAGQTGTGPLPDELVRTLQEVQLGVPRAKAMRNLAERTDQADLRRFVLAVIQADGYGIPIADVLRTQAAEQRVKRRQRAEEHAMKIPVKIAFPLIVCIMPTLFIVILGPAAIQLARTL
jgi:tight adherence protein C